MKTIAEFVIACEDLDHEGIYELFEDQIPDTLRDKIIAICPNPDHPEPVRFSLNVLGREYNVESLRTY